MTTEWKYLPTFQDVAEAQAQGLEIEYRHMNKEHWKPWNHTWWNEDSFFHARPRQPKMKKVKSLCWRNMATGNCAWTDKQCDMSNGYWQRFPAGDLEGEVPDEQ